MTEQWTSDVELGELAGTSAAEAAEVTRSAMPSRSASARSRAA